MLVANGTCDTKVVFEQPQNGEWKAPYATNAIRNNASVCINYDAARFFDLGVPQVRNRNNALMYPSVTPFVSYFDSNENLLARITIDEYSASGYSYYLEAPKGTARISFSFLGKHYSSEKLYWDSNFGWDFSFPVSN